MSMLVALGTSLVEQSEYLERVYGGFLSHVRESAPDKQFAIAGVDVSAQRILEPLNGEIPFHPIKYGDPLTVEIRWVYTGKFPKTSWGKKSKTILISSAFKSIQTFDESPRAVNLLREKVQARTDVEWSAVDRGTPLAFYTPAVSEDATVATIEITFDNFPDEILKKLAGTITAAGAIPVFAPQKIYFLAGSFLVKLLADVGHTVFDGDVVFRATELINFARPGQDATPAGWRVLCRNEDKAEISKLTVGPKGQLFDGANPYEGDAPYVVLSLDGRAVPKYEQFTATAVSAVLLDKFFGVKDSQEQSLETALEALKVYSDFRFRVQADRTAKELSSLAPQDPDYAVRKKTLEDELKAAKKNILHDELKL
jgi:hypothetical protein